MSKLTLDKYYTPINIANKCWKLVEKTIDLTKISDIIEPSVGNGSFCHYKIKPDWNSKVTSIAMKRLKQYMIFDELRKQGIKELNDN